MTPHHPIIVAYLDWMIENKECIKNYMYRGKICYK
jgi:hypothetical protein